LQEVKVGLLLLLRIRVLLLAENRNWDYIIVGGGSAGCVLANRLSSNSAVQVLLLDAGRNDKHLYSRVPAGQMAAFPRPDMNWLYQSEPDTSRADRVDFWPAGKIIGGGSAINGMMYVRGHKSDYDHWSALGNSGWSYDEVLPHFKSLENSEVGDAAVRGKSGPQSVSRVRINSPLNQAFIEAAQEVGIPYNPDLNGESQEGVGPCQTSQKRGWRHSTAQSFLKPALSRNNLQVELGAVATKILLENGRAVGVIYQCNGREVTVSAGRGVVLSAGAIASPKLLMLSGIGSGQALREHAIEPVHELPGVGKNLQEHPCVRMSFHVKNASTLTSDLNNPLRSLMHGLNYIFNGSGALATCIGHAHALAYTREGLSAPNAQIIFAPLSYDLTATGPKPYRKPAVGVGIGLCRIQSEGEITLRSSDPLAAPVIDYKLLANEDDLAQLREAIRLTRKIFDAEKFSHYFVDERLPGRTLETDEELNQYIRETSGLMFHPCGTAKMGQDDMAVVDEKLKVRGLEGLWVADASIFPTIPAGNINATCIMVGEKAAGLIQGQSTH
jgi:choline dehydrogenase-like flavoprotein